VFTQVYPTFIFFRQFAPWGRVMLDQITVPVVLSVQAYMQHFHFGVGPGGGWSIGQIHLHMPSVSGAVVYCPHMSPTTNPATATSTHSPGPTGGAANSPIGSVAFVGLFAT
jgi:hypothetical protein